MSHDRLSVRVYETRDKNRLHATTRDVLEKFSTAPIHTTKRVAVHGTVFAAKEPVSAVAFGISDSISRLVTGRRVLWVYIRDDSIWQKFPTTAREAEEELLFKGIHAAVSRERTTQQNIAVWLILFPSGRRWYPSQLAGMGGIASLVSISDTTADGFYRPRATVVKHHGESEARQRRAIADFARDQKQTSDVNWLCLRFVITRVSSEKHARQPVMFSAYVSRHAAPDNTSPLHSLYVETATGSVCWCVVPVDLHCSPLALLHVDAYQKMMNANKTRLTDCKIAYACNSLESVTTWRGVELDFRHCVAQEMEVLQVRVSKADKEITRQFAACKTPVYDMEETPRPTRTEIEAHTQKYQKQVHAATKELGGITALFPSGKTATNVIEVVRTPEAVIPLVSYFNMAVSGKERVMSAGLLENLAHLTCVLMRVTVTEAKHGLEGDDNTFAMNFLANLVRVLPTCLAYSVDKEGESNTMPFSVPNFESQQVDCEELGILCAGVFLQICTATGCAKDSLIHIVQTRVCPNYRPMLCIVTTSSTASKSTKVAEEADSTHLVCVLQPVAWTHSAWKPLLLETMSNVTPFPSSHRPRTEFGFLPEVLQPLHSQEEFLFDHVYRDVVHVFLHTGTDRGFVQHLVKAQKGKERRNKGVGAPFSDVLHSIPQSRLVAVDMHPETRKATDLSSEMTFPLGRTLFARHLNVTEDVVEKCKSLFNSKKCDHVFLFATDPATLSTTADSFSHAVQTFMEKTTKHAEANAARAKYRDLKSVDVVIADLPMHVTGGQLFVYAIGLMFKRTSTTTDEHVRRVFSHMS